MPPPVRLLRRLVSVPALHLPPVPRPGAHTCRGPQFGQAYNYNLRWYSSARSKKKKSRVVPDRASPPADRGYQGETRPDNLIDEAQFTSETESPFIGELNYTYAAEAEHPDAGEVGSPYAGETDSPFVGQEELKFYNDEGQQSIAREFYPNNDFLTEKEAYIEREKAFGRDTRFGREIHFEQELSSIDQMRSMKQLASPEENRVPKIPIHFQRSHDHDYTKLSLVWHRHVTVPGHHFTPYDAIEEMQDKYFHQMCWWKRKGSQDWVPHPRVFTFEPSPTYTLGRRNPLPNPYEEKLLTAELQVDLPNRMDPVSQTMRPIVRQSQRGGLMTYHGPGQLVCWAVVDMRDERYPPLGVRSWVALLEGTTQRLIKTLWDIDTYTTDEFPGLWVGTPENPSNRKIAAVGTHLRSFVTSYGISLNLDVATDGDKSHNPWSRIVPCGLEGKEVTSVEAELARRPGGAWQAWQLLEPWTMERLGFEWTVLFDEGLVRPEDDDVRPEEAAQD